MTVKEANKMMLELLQFHVKTVQSGSLGPPDVADLEFCGRLHEVIEKGLGEK